MSKSFKYKEKGPREGNANLAAIDKVPMLRYGPDTNFIRFKEAMSVAAVEKYGALGKLIEVGTAYIKPPPNIANYRLDDDPYGIQLEEYKSDLREYKRVMSEHELNAPKLYATICNKLSTESMDEVRRHEAFAEFHTQKDPVALWTAITELHQVPTTSKIDVYVKKAARDNYNDIKQGPFESIIPYKQRFDAAYEAYNDLENPVLSEIDAVMDFMSGLDDARYAEFKASLMNDIARGAMELPKTVNDMFVLASRYVVVNKRSNGTATGASFATADRMKPPAKQQESKATTAKSGQKTSTREPSGEKETTTQAAATATTKVGQKRGPWDKKNLKMPSVQRKGSLRERMPQCPTRPR